MRFGVAIEAMLGTGCSITRTAWGTEERHVYFEVDTGRIRYVPCERLRSTLRPTWNYYPVQDDMLAADWELCRRRHIQILNKRKAS